MELWRIGRTSPSDPTRPAQPIEYIENIINEANIDERLNVGTLALLILQECGGRCPVYEGVVAFQVFAVNWLKTRKEQINHLLDALFAQYNPLEEFHYYEHDVLDGRIKTDDTRNITEDNEHVNNGEWRTQTEETKTEEKSSTTAGNYDTATDETRTESGTIANNGGYTNTGTTDDVTDTGISADNENSFQPREHVAKDVDDTLTNTHNDTTTESKSTTIDNDVANTHTDTTTENNTITDNIDVQNTHTDTDTDDKSKTDVLDGLRKQDDVRDKEVYGHKTNSQLLVMQEFEVAQKNAYDIIVAWWSDALMLGIW